MRFKILMIALLVLLITSQIMMFFYILKGLPVTDESKTDCLLEQKFPPKELPKSDNILPENIEEVYYDKSDISKI